MPKEDLAKTSRRKLDRIIKNFSTRCKVRSTTAQSIGNESWTSISLENEMYDPAGLHASTSDTKIVVDTAGTYRIGGNLAFAASATDRKRGARLRVNGTNGYAATIIEAVSTGNTLVNIETELELAAGDYVELQGLQSTGGSLDVEKLLYTSPLMWLSKIS